MKNILLLIIGILALIFIASCSGSQVIETFKVIYQNGDIDTLAIQHHSWSFVYVEKGDLKVSSNTKYDIVRSGVRSITKISEYEISNK